MQLALVPVLPDDADRLARECDFPAMRQNPLHLIMFPSSTPETEEDEIQWYIRGLRETLQTRSADFRKVCLADGTPVGFAGWSLEQSISEKKMTRKECTSEKRVPTKYPKNEYWHPNTLDVKSWISVSKMFQQEKRRVLADRRNIWRLTMISVNPVYQRHGIGSLLLQWGTEEADRHGWDSFLISSPAAVKLYTKFGFQVVGEVHTSRGTFTSMYREAHLDDASSM